MSDAYKCDTCGKFNDGVACSIILLDSKFEVPTERYDLCPECLRVIRDDMSSLGDDFTYYNNQNKTLIE